jgi:hypothetical protein
MFTQALPECFMGMDLMSDEGTLSLSTTVEQKAYKSTLQATLIEHAK